MSGVKGRSGRKKIPTKDAIRRGTRGALERVDIALPAQHLECPADLPQDERDLWKRYEDLLYNSGIVCRVDELAFRNLIKSLAYLDRLEQQMGPGDVPELLRKFDVNGQLIDIIVPRCRNELRKARAEAQSFLRDFGMTPATHSNIKTIGRSDGDVGMIGRVT